MLVSQRYLDGVQVFALYVFHECHFHDILVLDGADVSRHSLQTSQLGRPPAPFSCNNLKPLVSYLAQGDGRDDAQFLDAVGKLFECFFVKLTSRLVRVRFNLADCNLADGRTALRPNIVSRYQCVKPASQCGIFFLCHNR